MAAVTISLKIIPICSLTVLESRNQNESCLAKIKVPGGPSLEGLGKYLFSCFLGF